MQLVLLLDSKHKGHLEVLLLETLYVDVSFMRCLEIQLYKKCAPDIDKCSNVIVDSILNPYNLLSLESHGLERSYNEKF